jgi:hypothetical protein
LRGPLTTGPGFYEACEKTTSAHQGLYDVPAAIHVAEKVGARLGSGVVLQRSLPPQ